MKSSYEATIHNLQIWRLFLSMFYEGRIMILLLFVVNTSAAFTNWVTIYINIGKEIRLNCLSPPSDSSKLTTTITLHRCINININILWRLRLPPRPRCTLDILCRSSLLLPAIGKCYKTLLL